MNCKLAMFLLMEWKMALVLGVICSLAWSAMPLPLCSTAQHADKVPQHIKTGMHIISACAGACRHALAPGLAHQSRLTSLFLSMCVCAFDCLSVCLPAHLPAFGFVDVWSDPACVLIDLESDIQNLPPTVTQLLSCCCLCRSEVPRIPKDCSRAWPR